MLKADILPKTHEGMAALTRMADYHSAFVKSSATTRNDNVNKKITKKQSTIIYNNQLLLLFQVAVIIGMENNV